MDTEDQIENPPAGEADGLGDGQSEETFDKQQYRPNGEDSQDNFDFEAFETELHGEPNGGGAQHERVVASWIYTDEHGAPLYKVDRVETGEIGADGKLKKKFKQSRSDGNGGWVSGAGCMDGVRRVPHRLPEMLAAIAAGEPIFILEGEKCVDIARALGVCATTNSGGAGTWPTEIIHWFAGADVIPSPDGNKVGHTHALKMARALSGVAKRVRIVALPGLGEKDDIEQWIAAGGTREQLLELAEQAPDCEPPPAEPEPASQREREPWSPTAEARVCDALRFISSDGDRNEDWLMVGMALHWTGWASGKTIYTNWSMSSPKYDPAALDSAWKSFHERLDGKVITLGSLFRLAKTNGWSPAIPDFSTFGSYEDASATPEPEPESANGASDAGDGEGGGATTDTVAGGTAPWPEPQPIGDGLLPVLPFSPDFLPPAIMDWVLDIAERKQCPVEYVAIPAIVALGTALGSKVEVRPKRQDDWANIANFWGMVIGRPGMLKSPAIDDVLKPLRGLEREARNVYTEAMRMNAVELEQWEAANKRDKKDETDLAGPKPEKPVQKRYLTSDTTYEMLGVMMAENPDGILVHRDELISLLRHLDKEEQCNARSFFMTAWNGASSYTFDRIGRGMIHIDRACLSVVGAATPSNIAKYIKRIRGGWRWWRRIVPAVRSSNLAGHHAGLVQFRQ